MKKKELITALVILGMILTVLLVWNTIGGYGRQGNGETVSKISTPTASATQAVAALPSPVSSQATVNGQCRVGIYDTVTQSFNPLSINTSAGNMFFDAVGEAYQMTLTNTGSSAAEIAGFSAVFYDSEGNETGSDNQEFDGPTFLEPGQSLRGQKILGEHGQLNSEERQRDHSLKAVKVQLIQTLPVNSQNGTSANGISQGTRPQMRWL